MGFVHGKDSYIKLGSSLLTGYVRSVEMSAALDVAESSTMGDESKEYMPGLSDMTISLEGLYDSQAIVNEVQTLSATGTVGGGQYKLRFDGQTTSDLAYNANNAAILAALNALSNIAPGDVVLGGGNLPSTPVTITFAQNYAGFDVPLITVQAGTSPLTGGGSYGVVQTTAGAGGPDALINSFMSNKQEVPFVFGPAGSDTGMPRYTATVTVSSYTVSAPIGDIVAFTADLQASGTITRDSF